MTDFAWGSLLGAGTALLLAVGILHVLIGVLAPWLGIPPRIVGLSTGSDESQYGKPSDELLEDPVVRGLRTHHVLVLGGLIFGLGVLEAGLAWFGLRTGQMWAVGTLAVALAGMVPFWVLMVVQVVQSGGRVGFWDVQPFVLLPTFLGLPACLLAWLGLRAG